MGALKSPWILQPVFEGFSILSLSGLWVEMPLMLLLTALFTWAVSGRRLLRVRRVPAWRSATIGVEGGGFLHRVRLRQPHPPGTGRCATHPGRAARGLMEENGRDDGSGPPDRSDPGWEEAAAHLRYASDVIEVVETYVYRPALGVFTAVVAAAKRLQSGRLDAWTPTCSTC
jgi:hydrogenase-4 component B